MAKYTPLAMLLFCAWASARASDKIPISAVPSHVRGAIQYYAPGALLTEARVTQDRTNRNIYICTYFRNIHLGSIKLSARGQLLDIDETLVVEDVPPAVRRTIHAETKGGLIRRIKLTAEYGRAIYRVKAFYGKSTDIEISLAITRSGRVVERKVSRGLFLLDSPASGRRALGMSSRGPGTKQLRAAAFTEGSEEKSLNRRPQRQQRGPTAMSSRHVT